MNRNCWETNAMHSENSTNWWLECWNMITRNWTLSFLVNAFHGDVFPTVHVMKTYLNDLIIFNQLKWIFRIFPYENYSWWNVRSYGKLCCTIGWGSYILKPLKLPCQTNPMFSKDLTKRQKCTHVFEFVSSIGRFQHSCFKSVWGFSVKFQLTFPKH